MTPELQKYLDEQFADWINPEPVSELSVPAFYANEQGHQQAVELLERDSSNAYAFALAWRKTGLPAYRDRALQYINAWAMRLQSVSSQGDSELIFVYKAQRFIMAALLLNLKAEERYPLLRFIATLYIPICRKLSSRWNNWGAWAWAGLAVSQKFISGSVSNEVLEGLRKHMKRAKSLWFLPIFHKKNHFALENARTTYGLKYGFFALEAYTLAAFVVSSPTTFLVELGVLFTAYWQYVENPQRFYWRKWKWIVPNFVFPSKLEFLVPSRTSWPAHIYCIMGVLFDNAFWRNYAACDVYDGVNALRFPKTLMEVWDGMV